MMGSGHKQFFDVILFNGFHPFDSAASPVLGMEIFRIHPFDITEAGHGDYGIGLRNQVFGRDIIGIIADDGSPVIAVFCGNSQNLLTNDTQELFLVGKDGFQFRYFCHQFLVFPFDLFPFQTGQRTQTHINNGLCLGIA